MIEAPVNGCCKCVHRRRAEELCLEHMSVLEVGGGDGRLSAHLRAAVAAQRSAASRCIVDIHCTDSGLRGLHVCSPFRHAMPFLQPIT